MKHAIKDAWYSLVRLFRFIAWYAIVVTLVFYLLPIVGLFLEEQYDAMSSSVKFFSVIGFFVVVAIWQITGHKYRIRSSMRNHDSVQTPSV
jgi:hypothetical protein